MGTFAVNVTGSFIVGVLFTVLTERWLVAPWLRSSLTIGLGSIAAGLAAVYAGVVVGRVI